jgi:hypothetical protein
MEACKHERLKMRKQFGKWIVEDRGENKIFDESIDAWTYVFLMREIRENPPQAPKTLYPVRSLNPYPTRGGKKVVYSGL